MNNQNEFSPSDQPVSFLTLALAGAVVALCTISFFVFGVDNPDPEWGKYWQIRPLIITPMAGAVGGAFYAFQDHQASRGFNRTLAVILSLVLYLIALWLGTVLGLAGTLWD